MAKGTKKKEPVLCPFAKKEKEKFGFDVTKADPIFDLLLQEGHILSAKHTILSAAELRNHKYYKWHNTVSHSANECRVFCKEIQLAIEAGRIKFDAPEKPMKIDGHPFPTNMVEVVDRDASTGPKLLTFERAKRSEAVDPNARVLASQLGGQGRYEQGEGSKKPRRRVTSKIRSIGIGKRRKNAGNRSIPEENKITGSVRSGCTAGMMVCICHQFITALNATGTIESNFHTRSSMMMVVTDSRTIEKAHSYPRSARKKS